MPYSDTHPKTPSPSNGNRVSDDSDQTITVKGFEEETVITLPRTAKPQRGRTSLFNISCIALIPHILLLAAYSGVILTWQSFKPHLRDSNHAPLTEKAVEHWEARFLGTFSEIGDYFNVSATSEPSPGAEAAWKQVQELRITPVERQAANYIRINRAHIESPHAGDAQALTHIHRLHCLHVLWRRWHGLISDEETAAGIALPVHDDHCFKIIRYALMCEGDLVIKQVGWTGNEDIREGWIEVNGFCEDPEVSEGVEAGRMKVDTAAKDS
ncbi:hypothetical protein GGR50DRAFT_692709 [Xylaria sp. CBS 124048]|nr:hypothetical protein GGR50DRAFT_692709 [Xylaria sp. CBS 124048]